jgi:hypothetical protein
LKEWQTRRENPLAYGQEEEDETSISTVFVAYVESGWLSANPVGRKVSRRNNARVITESARD